ncbi:MAG: TetR/AcrR family transcriptional regulator [Bacteroidota bacterium]
MAPRSEAQFEEIRNKSKAKIKEAALELFARQGFDSTSMAQVAKKAGVAKGLPYNYFASKDELLMAVIEDLMKEGEHLIGQAFAIEDPKEKLKHIIETTFEWLQLHSDRFKLVTALSLQMDQLPPKIRDIVGQKFGANLEIFGPLMKEAGLSATDDEALMFGAMMDGIAVQYMVMKDDYPLERIKAAIFRTWFPDETH